ncbi:LysR family transcriptional regulator [Paenibacillus hexagrammi]|uniref:LysR family transcriptional regulator n=1 Tax=Paenibacillus hexagrammi TaxID=2908839 RepID=A0ABY3SK45_9BACL|nr:LysR family transcriptional regulator [Paenibacillus sp. YPD9-1]UJF33890.1 LysR family transcriptional regulator [Paenibacillus sp. YPD9-1]
MDIQYYVTFREVARSLNYTRAAETLGYSQPSITVQIQKLEKYYGVKLIGREGKSLQLTPGGVQFLAYADRIVTAHMEAKYLFSAQDEVELKIGTIETMTAYFLPPYLQQMKRQFPNSSLTIIPSNEPDIMDQVKKGSLDIGIILDPHYSDPQLRTIAIRREELIVVCPPGHELLKRREISISELADSQLLLTEKGCTYRSALEQQLEDQRVHYQVISELGSIEAIKQCIRIGLGIALIPKITVQTELDKGQLGAIPLAEGSLPDFYTQIILSKNKFITPALEHFISLLTSTGES